KVCWVKWEEVCKPKKEGGLGVRDLRLVNLSLLAKWRWKLLSHDYAGWKEILTAKYGDGILGNGNIGEEDVTRLASTWWRDLCRLDIDSGWFGSSVGKKVGNGTLTSFWNDIWVGGQTLRHRFPRLFGIFTQKNAMISAMGTWVENQWRWELSWRRVLFVWEVDIQNELLELINLFVPTGQQDRWLWLGASDEGFTVHATYLISL
ncbi:putative non-LTR retroelement reverse transcriptase, partial [Trifolium medium]|nr:putative non-LTR retroelement reverse transcriptase [Trifolium medium]